KPELLKIDIKATQRQIKLLKQYKNKRNSNNVTTALGTLMEKARTTQNIFPQILDCVKNDCTLGEISDALRTIFGEYNQN
ncbi:MAG: methylmalonyl-CoA mutase family protein, partial [Candidatus Marinimicrobia bacterium]|nr:methylmalonyl-CoA mutase family protein [Candidatus Neomarinimicrobiota bacterium]